MLTPEQAREQLKQFEIADARKQTIERCGALTPLLRELGVWLAGWETPSQLRDKPRDAFFTELKSHASKFPSGHGEGALESAEWAREHAEYASAVLETVSADERLALFAALFPKLAPVLASAWSMIQRFPYQTGWQRRSFRAPNSPALLRAKRCNWLRGICELLRGYDPDAGWCATWAGHFARYGSAHQIAMLLAGAIEAGGDTGQSVFDILAASVRSEHEIAVFGSHASRALLAASRADGWELIEKTLLAAQRQEGLRQAILESVDECHPHAFRRMLKLIIDEKLIRFSATVRAAAVWFGVQLESATPAIVEKLVRREAAFLDDKEAREAALSSGPGEDAYLALWSIAFDDVMEALPRATRLLDDVDPERRFASVYLLCNAGIRPATPKGRDVIATAMKDEDLRIAAQAFLAFRGDPEFFADYELLLKRLPEKKQQLKPIIWPWMAPQISREDVADRLPQVLGERAPAALIPYLEEMGVYGRATALKALAEENPWAEYTRIVIVKHLGDPSSHVRATVLKALEKAGLRDGDAPELEKLLARKAGDLRQGILKLLAQQKDDRAIASAKRLLAVRENWQRIAGLELLNILSAANRGAEACRNEAAAYKSTREELSADEKQLLEGILKDASAPALTLDNALGLLDPAQRTPPAKLEARPVQFHTPASVALVASLDALIHENREREVPQYNGQTTPLGAMRWFNVHYNIKKSTAEQLEALPLRPIWERWLRERDESLRDKDGLELIRAQGLLDRWRAGQRQNGPTNFWQAAEPRLTPEKLPGLKYENLINGLLPWLIRMQNADAAAMGRFLLDAAETVAALIPPGKVFTFPPKKKKEEASYYYGRTDDLLWRGSSPLKNWLDKALEHASRQPELWKADAMARLYRLCRWYDEPTGEGVAEQPVPRHSAPVPILLAAYKAGVANKADLLDELLGGGGQADRFNLLDDATRRKPPAALKDHPDVIELAERCRERVLDCELTRGDLPTVASKAACEISSVWGIANLVRLLVALGPRKLVRGSRGYWRRTESKEEVLSHLIRVTFPADKERAADFARAIEKAAIPEKRLIELAIFAPQWAKFTEHALSWQGLENAVWWIRAHTKDSQWSVEQEIRDEWNAEVQERTPLTGQDLLEGGVDVGWFHRCFEPLGAKRWEKLSEAAKFASSGVGHTRAQVFAAAMLGQLKKPELLEKINAKRHQDSVRALGLLPLPAGAGAGAGAGKQREKDVLERYQTLQEFLRSSRQFGSMRQESEKRAARIGQQNLARTAGFSDPLRLQWAMEARAVADLAEGPIRVEVDGFAVTLEVDALGEVSLTAAKDGQARKDIPAKLKKEKSIAELRKRSTDLKRQASRMRQSLEDLMIRGEKFSGAELKDFMKHPLLAPLLRSLVLVGGDGLGYPEKNGAALTTFDASKLKINDAEQLRIAHPHDLLASRKWQHWQKECFSRERIQPFKQVFRELYILTEQEKKDKTVSHRYSGQQVNPKQAMALLGSRGWVAHPEEGVRKTFHAEGLTVNLTFNEGVFTPLEMEGLTVEGVAYSKRNDWHALPLSDIPPRIFSETMRDLDLVVSVAHQGGVDPEASASTTEMRTALLREALQALKIKNVRFSDNHAMVDGTLAHYSVHLGSGNVHLLPGGSLCLVPVHAQHRGRLFLPFADNDPRTAEVMSKVLLLARDTEIKDPQLLDQIRARD